ncbi:hypothetical protein ACFL35_21125, partial [Candidatus Riflebacteria bacterium]
MFRIRFQATLLSFILVFLVPTVLVISLSLYYSATFATIDLSSQIINQTAERIEQKVTDFLNTATSIARTNKNLLESGTLSDKKFDTLGKLYHWQLKEIEDLNYITLGTENGDKIECFRGSNGSLTVRELIRDSEGNVSGGDYRIEGTKKILIKDQTGNPYDPRIRPWYKAGKEARSQVWTDSYIFTAKPPTPSMPGCSFVIPLYRPNGVFFGISLADFTYYSTCNFLKSLKIGKRGIAFIVEYSKKGERNVIAHPDPTKLLQKNPDGSLKLVPLVELADARVQGFARLLPDSENTGGLFQKKTITFPIDGKDFLGTFRCLDFLRGEKYPRWVIC